MAGHALREILDVGVVSVVESAQLAHAVEQAAPAGPVLPEVRLRDQQGRIIGVAALDVEGRAERYGHRAGRLLDQERLRCPGSFGGRSGARRERAHRQRFEILPDSLRESLWIAAADSNHQSRLREFRFVETPHIAHGHALQRGHGTEIVMAVGPAVEDAQIEGFLGQLLFVGIAQTDTKVVDGAILYPLQIVLAPAGSEKDAAKQRVVFFQVVNIGRAAEHDHLLIHLARQRSGHGKHGVEHLLIGQLARASTGYLRRGQAGQTGLIRGIVSGTGEENDAKVDERRAAGLGDYTDLRLGGAAAEQQNQDRPHRRPPVSVTMVLLLSTRYFLATRWMSCGEMRAYRS